MNSIAAVVVASNTRNSAALINYVLSDRPDQTGERYVIATGTNGAFVSKAEQQFRDVRKRFGKNRPGQFVHAYHVVQSFANEGTGALDPSDPDAWAEANLLGLAMAEEVSRGRQAIVVTQRDGRTGCLHNHIVVNSVHRESGKSFLGSWITHSRLVQQHDGLLEGLGYTQRDDLRQAASDSRERYERGEGAVVRGNSERSTRLLQEASKWEQWDAARGAALDAGTSFDAVEPFSEDVLAGRIRDAMAEPDVVDFDTFVEAGAKHGVKVTQRGKKGRGITYGMIRQQGDEMLEPTSRQSRRCATLGEDFSMDAVEDMWAQRAQDQAQAQAQQVAQQHAQQQAVAAHEKATKEPAPEPTATQPRRRRGDPIMSAEEMLAAFDQMGSAQALKEATQEPASEPAPEPTREDQGVDSAAATSTPTEAAAAAPAPDEPAPVPAPAAAAPGAHAVDFAAATSTDGAAARQGYVSGLREATSTSEKRQSVIDQMAAFDEHAVALHERGERFLETDVPRGVGRRFLDDYGEKIDPGVLAVLSEREDKKEFASRLMDRAGILPSEVAQGMRDKARRIRQEIADSNYALEEQTPAKSKAQRMMEAPSRSRDRDQGMSLG